MRGKTKLAALLVAGATLGSLQANAAEYTISSVKALTGPLAFVGDGPVIGTLDAHANLSPRMVSACDALVAYRSNPHLDQRDRGLEAARLMVRTLRGEIRPVQAAAQATGFPP